MGEKPLSVTVLQAQKLTGLGANTLYDLVNSGQLKSTKVGGRRLIVYAALEEMIEKGIPKTRDSARERRGRGK